MCALKKKKEKRKRKEERGNRGKVNFIELII